jgi:hypothetical protein
VDEPLDPEHARRVIREILKTGIVDVSSHAETEMAKDNLTMVDCVNVLRAGVVAPAEYEYGSWRYRVRAGRIYVVIAFRSEQRLVIITAWRIR